MWIRKSQETKNNLIQWRKKSQRLLYSILPKHIAILLQSGVQPNCICEVVYTFPPLDIQLIVSHRLVASVGHRLVHLSDRFQNVDCSARSSTDHHTFERNYRNLRSNRWGIRRLQSRNQSRCQLHGRCWSQRSISHWIVGISNIQSKQDRLRLSLTWSIRFFSHRQ